MPVTSTTERDVALVRPPHPRLGSTPLSAVVGFDGSKSSLAALAVAENVVGGRNGHLEVVYVAHLLPEVSATAEALVGVRQGFQEIANQLSDTVETELQSGGTPWHFQRRDGSVRNELVLAARELRRQQGPDAIVIIVVGSAEHLIHHVLNSAAATLSHETEFPMMMVPFPTQNLRH